MQQEEEMGMKIINVDGWQIVQRQDRHDYDDTVRPDFKPEIRSSVLHSYDNLAMSNQTRIKFTEGLEELFKLD